MVLAFAKVMLSFGHNPANTLWAQCIDIDRTAALMCYIQLSLWNIPAQILVGNTLTMEFNEQYYTPAYYLNGWEAKLKWHELMDFALEREAIEGNESIGSKTPQQKRKLSTEPSQLKLF